jgi:hypothetical protein
MIVGNLIFNSGFFGFLGAEIQKQKRLITNKLSAIFCSPSCPDGYRG